MKKLQVQAYTVPSAIQVATVSIIFTTFIIQLVYLLYTFVLQYQENSHVGGAYAYLVTTELVPIVLFLGAYGLNPRKLAFMARSFESLILTTAGLSIWSTINFILPQITVGSGSFIENYAQFQIISGSTFVLLYLAALTWFRQSKHWR